MPPTVLLSLILAATTFPGSDRYVNRSGQLAVEGRDYAEPTPAANHHALFVIEVGTGRETKLMEFPRSVSVQWSPREDNVAVTDFVGSNRTEVHIFVLKGVMVVRHLVVRQALETAFPKLRGELAGYLHVHVEAVRWRGRRLECRLVAYAGDEKPTSRRYLVGLDGREEAL